MFFSQFQTKTNTNSKKLRYSLVSHDASSPSEELEFSSNRSYLFQFIKFISFLRSDLIITTRRLLGVFAVLIIVLVILTIKWILGFDNYYKENKRKNHEVSMLLELCLNVYSQMH